MLLRKGEINFRSDDRDKEAVEQQKLFDHTLSSWLLSNYAVRHMLPVRLFVRNAFENEFRLCFPIFMLNLIEGSEKMCPDCREIIAKS